MWFSDAVTFAFVASAPFSVSIARSDAGAGAQDLVGVGGQHRKALFVIGLSAQSRYRDHVSGGESGRREKRQLRVP